MRSPLGSPSWTSSSVRHHARDDVRLPYRRLAKRGVTFRQETVLAIDPQRCRIVTDGETYEADCVVVALGADYDLAATPGGARTTQWSTVASFAFESQKLAL
jgi:NADH dehydrogenase FAD-containing subunit